ncbi:putative Ctype lysozyme/alpha-lactalbumin superfamily protein [Paratrimastix pyriformis]|uniref:Ctype lysozyme/alpha-lactalbumin superfamily protein n=1 Tax=Paratrimastix pyriformis TaxID=342808 RepID=A0ABQ8UIY0_9EUKA|nr:putative Ctype lysozyme/alpha-lactalbumin superfamily protein [Paratrimastix pyriformis]
MVPPCAPSFPFRITTEETVEHRRGIYFFLKGNLRKAERQFTRVLYINPRRTAALLFRALVAEQSDDLPQCLIDLASALEISKDSTSAMTLRGLIRYKQARYSDAAADCNNALRVDPELALALLVRGFSYQRLGKTYKRMATTDLDAAARLGAPYAAKCIKDGFDLSRPGVTVALVLTYLHDLTATIEDIDGLLAQPRAPSPPAPYANRVPRTSATPDQAEQQPKPKEAGGMIEVVPELSLGSQRAQPESPPSILPTNVGHRSVPFRRHTTAHAALRPGRPAVVGSATGIALLGPRLLSVGNLACHRPLGLPAFGFRLLVFIFRSFLPASPLLHAHPRSPWTQQSGRASTLSSFSSTACSPAPAPTPDLPLSVSSGSDPSSASALAARHRHRAQQRAPTRATSPLRMSLQPKEEEESSSSPPSPLAIPHQHATSEAAANPTIPGDATAADPSAPMCCPASASGRRAATNTAAHLHATSRHGGSARHTAHPRWPPVAPISPSGITAHPSNRPFPPPRGASLPTNTAAVAGHGRGFLSVLSPDPGAWTGASTSNPHPHNHKAAGAPSAPDATKVKDTHFTAWDSIDTPHPTLASSSPLRITAAALPSCSPSSHRDPAASAELAASQPAAVLRSLSARQAVRQYARISTKFVGCLAETQIDCLCRQVTMWFEAILLLACVLGLTSLVSANELIPHNETNSGCSTCGGASYTDISSACSRYSGWSQSCCECIAQHESGGNYHACNVNSNGSTDVGLWQVNSMNWASCNSGNPPCDISSNLQCAIKVFNWGGNTWKYWSTCGGCGCCGSR